MKLQFNCGEINLIFKSINILTGHQSGKVLEEHIKVKENKSEGLGRLVQVFIRVFRKGLHNQGTIG